MHYFLDDNFTKVLLIEARDSLLSTIEEMETSAKLMLDEDDLTPADSLSFFTGGKIIARLRVALDILEDELK